MSKSVEPLAKWAAPVLRYVPFQRVTCAKLVADNTVNVRDITTTEANATVAKCQQTPLAPYISYKCFGAYAV